MTLTSLVRGTAQFFALAVVLGSGCADKVRTAISPCPCASGYVCCESGVCARDSASCGAATAALSAAAQGRWTGYVENASFRSGSDLLELSFSVDASGALSGTVFVGNAMPPEPPTDPDIGWPTDRPYGGTYVEGFPYEAHDVRWQAARLKFTIAAREASADWCALQTSYPYANIGGSPSPTYYCIPTNGYPGTNDGAGHCTIGLPPQSPDSAAAGRLREASAVRHRRRQSMQLRRERMRREPVHRHVVRHRAARWCRRRNHRRRGPSDGRRRGADGRSTSGQAGPGGGAPVAGRGGAGGGSGGFRRVRPGRSGRVRQGRQLRRDGRVRQGRQLRRDGRVRRHRGARWRPADSDPPLLHRRSLCAMPEARGLPGIQRRRRIRGRAAATHPACTKWRRPRTQLQCRHALRGLFASDRGL